MHLKRKAIPKSWPLARKAADKYVTKGKGPMPSKISMPLVVVLRDMLKALGTGAEAKKILCAGDVLVDGKAVKDGRFRVGLFDRIYLKRIDKLFTPEMNGKKMEIIEIDRKEMGRKPAKVIGKKSVDEKRMQINFYDGKNITVDAKEAGKISTGDSAVIGLEGMKIEGILKLEKGASVFVTGGKHQGERGKIASVGEEITIKKDNEEFKASRKNVFVIEK